MEFPLTYVTVLPRLSHRKNPELMRHSLHSLGEEVAKVKKRTGVTGERNVKGKSAGRKAKGGRKAVARTRSKQPAKARKKVAPKRGKQVKTARAPVVRMAVKPLDPLRKCGPKTTVQLLFRVDEQVDGRNTSHLVFFDRHGWYCEHGRSCPAVGHARKFNGQIARAS